MWNLFRFLRSEPMAGLDPNGLNDPPSEPTEPGGSCFAGCMFFGSAPPVSCDTICSAALQNPNIQKKGAGGVICFNGTKCECTFPVVIDNIPLNPGDCPDIDEIIKEHETKHFPEVDCKGCELQRPDRRKSISWEDSECGPMRDSIEQLKKLRLKKGLPVQCQLAIDGYVGELEKQVKDNCPETLIVPVPPRVK